ncbi:MAG: hypothetical protein GC164_05530 [Phycisphaera sp.]|nr:hypothetical protein [Phycisphaera sp.]
MIGNLIPGGSGSGAWGVRGYATGDGQYADVMERALYNGVISGVSLSGDRFYYDNYLASCPPYHKFAHRRSADRQEWFDCSCCPTNIARLLASLGQYVYSASSRELRINLFASNTFTGELAGTPVTVKQTTEYPWQEKVRIVVTPEQAATFTLAVRIPGWCRGARIRLNGKSVPLGPITKKGYASLRRTWSPGDRIELVLPMPVERIEAHPSVRHDVGKLALQRGPVVYCLEEVDNGKDLAALALPADAKLTAKYESNLLGGVTTITANAQRLDTANWKSDLYRPAGSTRSRRVPIKAVPYCVWANRKPGEMVVWVRQA